MCEIGVRELRTSTLVYSEINCVAVHRADAAGRWCVPALQELLVPAVVFFLVTFPFFSIAQLRFSLRLQADRVFALYLFSARLRQAFYVK